MLPMHRHQRSAVAGCALKPRIESDVNISRARQSRRQVTFHIARGDTDERYLVSDSYKQAEHAGRTRVHGVHCRCTGYRRAL